MIRHDLLAENIGIAWVDIQMVTEKLNGLKKNGGSGGKRCKRFPYRTLAKILPILVHDLVDDGRRYKKSPEKTARCPQDFGQVYTL